jgi:hypothetical protein
MYCVKQEMPLFVYRLCVQRIHKAVRSRLKLVLRRIFSTMEGNDSSRNRYYRQSRPLER